MAGESRVAVSAETAKQLRAQRHSVHGQANAGLAASALCADISGICQRAAVRCGAGDRRSLEQSCPCITRPTLADEWVQCNAAGQVVLELETPSSLG